MIYTENQRAYIANFEANYTYIQGFLRNVHRGGERPALFSPLSGERYTYRTLNSQVNRLAAALSDCGVGKGDVVMYLLRNSCEFVFCYLAPQKLGAVGCPVNYRLSPGEIALHIDDSRPKVFIYDSLYADSVAMALSMCRFRPEQVVSVETGGGHRTAHRSFSDFVAGAPDTEPSAAEPLGIYDETTRLYTSGTTRQPKGVPLYSINEVLSAHDVIMHFPLSPMDRTMNLTPWFHRGGLHSGGPCPTLYAGGEVVVMAEFDAGRALQYTEDYRISFLIGVPSVLSMLCRSQCQSPRDLSCLKGIVTMGAPLEKEDCIRFMEVLTPNIFNGYGTTETFWNTFLRPYDLPEHAGSAGRAGTDDDVRIVKVLPDRRAEPDELVAKDGKEIGEIILGVTAKSGMCYYGNEALSEEKFHKGFFYSGDLGTWDEDSFVTIVTRKDDMIVSAGENIYPAQVESVLAEHPDVAETCVVGVPDKLRGQIVAAYVVPKGDGLTVRDLARFVNAHPMLAAYKRPKLYCLCKELPHTATGKLQRAVVRKQAPADLEKGILHK